MMGRKNENSNSAPDDFFKDGESAERLRESEANLQRYRLLAEKATDVIWLVRPDGKIVEVNEAATKVYGYSREECLRLNVRDLREKSTLPLLDEQLKQANETGLTFETVHVRKDGTAFPVEINATGGDFGGERFLLSVVRDISERKRAEEALRESQRKLETALKAGRMGSWTLDLTRGELVASDACKVNYGRPPGDEFTYQNLADSIFPEDLARWHETVDQAIRQCSEFEIEYRVFWLDDSVHWVLVRGNCFADEMGKTNLLAGVSIDITERKRSEEALRESEEKYRTLFDSIDEGFCVIEVLFDEQGKPFDYRFLDINPAFIKQTDLTDAIGKTMLDFAPEMESHWFEIYGRVAMTGEPERYENRAAQLHRWYEVYAFRVGAPEERKVAVLFNDISERKQAEIALRESEERFRLASGAAEMFSWEIDLTTGAATIGENFAEVVGVALPEFPLTVENAISALIHPDDAPTVAAEVQKSIAGDGFFRREYRVFNPETSEIRWVESQAIVIGGAKHSAPRLVGITQNINDRKRREANLVFLAEATQDLVRLTNISETMDSLGAKIGHFFGVKQCLFIEHADEFETSIVADGWNAKDAPDLKGTYRTRNFLSDETMTAIKAGEPLIVNETQTDGRVSAESYGALGIRSFIIVPLLRLGEWQFQISIIDDKPRNWTDDEIALVRELTDRIWTRLERARAEEALGESETRYRTLFESIDEGFCVIEFFDGPHGQLSDYVHVAANPAYTINAGIPDIVGQKVREMVPDEADGWVEIYRNVLITGKPVRFERELVATGRHLELAAFRVEPPERKQVAVIFKDVTDRKSAERERERLLAKEQAARQDAEQANRLKDEFLATVSHELRTPLNAILGWSSMLQSNNVPEEMRLRADEMIYRSAKSQAQLIEDLLDVSRIITGKMKFEPRPIQLASVVASAIHTLRPAADAKSIRLETFLDCQPCAISGDAQRLQQIVWNLISNAVKFTPDGGRVEIRLENDDSHARLTVQDTGKGIEPEFLPFIFDRFRQEDGTSTRRYGGLGLGLAIVRHLVELHGGRVSAASAGAGSGATFTIELPLLSLFVQEEKPSPHSAPGNLRESLSDGFSTEENNAPQRLTGISVLLVDDEPATLELLDTVLTAEGAEVQTASSAGAAFEIFQKWQPDVIVSDIAMPIEDGYSLIARIRALAPDAGGRTPAIAMTAYVRVEDRIRVLQSGFQMYVPKPAEPFELTAAITNLVVAKK